MRIKVTFRVDLNFSNDYPVHEFVILSESA
jgi:hypothetical protein